MRNIKVIDHLHPEDTAMLQALYSRSPASVDSHLEKVAASGSGNFMGQFYIGYGHASIGDCGSTTIFIENVSILAAKAIQDSPMYSGQESSTRYIDFSKQEILDPLFCNHIQNKWMDFYHKAGPEVIKHLSEKYPRNEGEDSKVYDRAIKARSFDILRGFLPAGATTNVSWHTNLRQAADKVAWLRHHPLQEVQQIAEDIFSALKEKYPNSFRKDKEEVSAYKAVVMSTEAYNEEQQAPYCGIDEIAIFAGNLKVFNTKNPMLTTRPKGAVLPHSCNELGTLDSSFVLDFGSFRDLQRHRNGNISMPYLGTELGFHPWYIEQLPEHLKSEAEFLVQSQTKDIQMLPKYSQQYYTAMGFMVNCSVIQSLPAWLYRVELRTSKTVHTTLRNICLKEAQWFKNTYPSIAFHPDMDPEDWDIRRGKQTIEVK